MRNLLSMAIIVNIALMPFTSYARPAAKSKVSRKFDGRLVSWGRLMRMSPKKRAAYLAEVRQVLALMARSQKKYEIASYDSHWDELKSRSTALMQIVSLFPVATADPANPVATAALPPPLPAEETCSKVPVFDQQTGEFSEGCDCEDLIYEPFLKVCAVVRKHSSKKSYSYFWEGSSCPSGTVSVPVSPGSKRKSPGSKRNRCITQESFSGLSQPDQKALLAGRVRISPAATEPAAPAGTAAVAPPPRTSGPEPGHALVEAGTGGPASASPPPGSVTMDNPGPAAAPKSQGLKKEGGNETEPASTASQGQAGSCKPERIACEQIQDKDKLIKEFRDSKDAEANVCVTGGFFSQYKNGVKSERNCRIVQRWPEKGETSFDCGTQALCNPVAFCLVASGFSIKVEGQEKPYTRTPMALCADRGQDITESCNKKYLEVVKTQKPQWSQYVQKNTDPNDFKELAKATVEDCPNGIDGLPNGAKEEWEKLRDEIQKKYASMCLGNKGFQALFCTECNIIGERIAAMNQNATGTPCPESPAAPARPAAPLKQPTGAPTGGGEAVREYNI